MQTMNPEERFERIERQLEFLAANQAQHDARIAENSRQIGELTGLTLRIGRIVEVQAGHVDQLTERTDQLGRVMEELAQSQRRTDERLNILINIVERYFSNGHK